MVRRKMKGFTLVELLVAVSLLAVLLGLLFGAMRTGIRSWQAAERQIETVEAAGQAERFLARIISQAQAASGQGRGTSGVGRSGQEAGSGVFAGTGDRFSVVAPGVDALPRSGLYRYEVFFESRAGAGGAGDLWVRIDPHRPGEEGGSGSTPRLLRDGVKGFGVRYFGIVEDRQPAGWVEEWPEDAGLPLLVEIRVSPANGPARPAVVAAPEAAGGA